MSNWRQRECLLHRLNSSSEYALSLDVDVDVDVDMNDNVLNNKIASLCSDMISMNDPGGGVGVGDENVLVRLLGDDLDYVNLANLSLQWLLRENGTEIMDDDLDNQTSSMTESMEFTRNAFAMTWWQHVFWILAFALMVIVATGGNLIVIWIVMTHKRMRSVTNYFLVNLSVADAMVSTLNVIFNLFYMLSRDWLFGELYCTVSNFVAVVSVAASVLTMMAISVDRYIAIMSPLRPRMSKMTTLIITFIIWSVSGVLSLPNLLYSSVYVRHYDNGTYRTICYLEWPDGETASSYQEHVYNVAILVFTYLLPISAMVFTYTRIGRELWGSQSIGECTAKQLESVKSKRRVVKMMIVVVIIFAICWLPYHCYFIVVYYHQDIILQPYIQHIYLAIYWLAMSNSMYNPIIYCWMNARFRHGFRKVFWWCPGLRVENGSKAGYGGTDRSFNHANVRYSCSHSPDMSTRVDREALVHISLHTLTDVVCDGPGQVDNEGHQSNGSRHLIASVNFFRKLKPRIKPPSAV